MGKSKIFIGPVDIANQAMMFKEIFNRNDITCDYYSYRNGENNFSYQKDKTLFQFISIPRILGKNITQVINNMIKVYQLVYLIFRYNTFIFNLPHTLLPKNRDLKILKFLNKKIVIVFSGCPDRVVEMYPDDPEYICNRCEDKAKQNYCLCTNIASKKERIRKFERYSDHIIAQSDSAGYLKRKNFLWYYVISRIPERKNYLSKFDTDEIIITHFPSNPKIKLSDIIIPILEEVAKERSNVRLIIKTNIPNSEVLEHLENTHILVDALGLSYGVLGIEGMSRGCVTVVGKMKFIDEKLGGHPLIACTGQTLKKSLLELIDNRSLLREQAKRSLDFFYKYHTVEAAEGYYMEGLGIR